MKRSATICGLTLLVVGLMSTNLQAQDDPNPQKVRIFMKAKLKHAQDVLRGLALEDYDTIAQSSNKLGLLSQEADWNVLKTPQYAQHSADFRKSVDRLTKAGREKTLDAATLAYLEVTMRCVECHKYVRRARITSTRKPTSVESLVLGTHVPSLKQLLADSKKE